MTDELLSLHNILCNFIELSCLRHSEVVAFDVVTMLLEELCKHLRPLVCRVTPITRWKHDVGISRANLVLIVFDCSDGCLINHDSACARLLADDIELTMAIFVRLESRDGTEGQADGILYA